MAPLGMVALLMNHRDPKMLIDLAKTSLYRKPVYIEKHPIKSIMYLPLKKVKKISFLLLSAIIFSSFQTRYSANNSIISPWPASPNMTANRNGNVMIVNGAGFTSR